MVKAMVPSGRLEMVVEIAGNFQDGPHQAGRWASRRRSPGRQQVALNLRRQLDFALQALSCATSRSAMRALEMASAAEAAITRSRL